MKRVKSGVFRRGKSYYVRIVVNGRLIRKSCGPDKRKAELVYAELQKQRAVARVINDWSGVEALFKPKSRMTFEEAAEVYMSEREHNKASTRETYRQHLDNHLLPALAKRPVVDITESEIAALQNKLARSLSPARTNSTINLLRSILKTCTRRGILDRSPADGVPRMVEQAPDINPLKPEELSRVLSCIPEPYGAFFTCQAWTGARPGELKALRWSDIDFESRQVHIRKARYRGVESTPKTRSSRRTIPMLPPVYETLTKLRRASKLANIDGYVFVDAGGEPLDRHLDRVWATAMRKARVKHRPSYQLRHSFASLWLKAGGPPDRLSKILGHTTMQMTFKHYARFIEDGSKPEQRLAKTLFPDSGEWSQNRSQQC